MRLIERSQRAWGQVRALPRAHQGPAWLVSLVLHLSLILVLALLTVPPAREGAMLVLSATEYLVEEMLPEEFHFSPQPAVEVGASSWVEARAPLEAEEPKIPDLTQPAELARIRFAPLDTPPQAPNPDSTRLVRGAAGAATTGALGAVDRITHEILLSLEQRPTLVVWVFDQSGSLERQRETIVERFDRIYEELGVVEASGNPAFANHHDKPLLTSIVAFGQSHSFRTAKPTDQLDEIKKAITSIETDPSGRELVFTVVGEVVKRYRTYRTQHPRRNVMIVIFTDEAGDDDADQLDQAVLLCRKQAMPVYVVGVPAPFGRREAMVKYVDPDPKYDQTPQRVPVHQGPESLLPERIKLHFRGSGSNDITLDSGFGPYGLTRLCVETGGIFFVVHPNRTGKSTQRLGWNQTTELASHLSYFFDPTIMQAYRPDYVPVSELQRLLKENKARRALVEAASLSWVTPMESVRLTFPKQSDAALANLLSEAQRDAAKLEPKIQQMYEILRQGESDREKLVPLRWQAGYDLAMGRTLAVKVRTETYNGMLAQIKKGMKFQDAKSDTWQLKPADNIALAGTLAKQAEQAENYLKRVVNDHEGTPWALLAQRELAQPFGFEWTELTTGVEAPRGPGAPGVRMRMQDDKLRMLKKPKPKRKPPAL